MIDLTSLYRLEEPCVLMPLPCGCVIDSSIRAENGIVLCPWCGATFNSVEFGVWINNGDLPVLFLEEGPKPMIRSTDGRLHEVCGEFDGLPIVQAGRVRMMVDNFEWVSN